MPAAAGPQLPALDALVVLWEYDRTARAVITGIKYRNRRDALSWCAHELATRVLAPVEMVTWAPTTAARRRERGFDHAELLARRVASALGVPARPLLHRIDRDAQTGRSRGARLHGPRVVARTGVAEGWVLLVDDVVTTGTTLAHGAVALRGAGARHVVGAALARTPARVGGI